MYTWYVRDTQERGSLRMGAEASARSRREALSLGVTAEVAEQKQELKGGVRHIQG